MRARIIFRGLTLFTFDKPTESASAGDNLGTLTAWLVSDPRHNGMPLHTHTPYLALIGRDRGVSDGPGRAETKRPIPPEMRVELMGHGLAAGVTAEESFLDYVPRLGGLHWDQSTGPLSAFITRRIVIPSGKIRARNFITWDWHGNTPTRVAYMDTNVQGFGANEVIVDIGDDSDTDHHDDARYLGVSGRGVDEKLWARVKGAAFDEDIDPNTCELLITNLPARRRRAVFWGMHFQTLFDAAGYKRRTAYANVAQYTSFVEAAEEYDSYEWLADVGMMGIGQPFPFLIDPRRDRLDGLENVSKPRTAVVPPLPPGRQRNEGIPKGNGGGGGHGGHGGHGGMAMGHDPENTQICPFGRE